MLSLRGTCAPRMARLPEVPSGQMGSSIYTQEEKSSRKEILTTYAEQYEDMAQVHAGAKGCEQGIPKAPYSAVLLRRDVRVMAQLFRLLHPHDHW